jgi:hypothetical protein
MARFVNAQVPEVVKPFWAALPHSCTPSTRLKQAGTSPTARLSDLHNSVP